MRVLLSAGMIQGGRSGVGRYVTRIADAFARRGVDLVVAGLGVDRGLFPLIEESRWLEIPAAAAGGVRNLFWHQRELPGELVRRKVDLVHIPSYRRILWRSPVRQIGTVHDCAPFVLRKKYGMLRGIFGRWLTPFAARRCEKIITVSGVSAGHIRRFLKVDEGRIRVVWNGIDHGRYRPPSASEMAAFREREKLAGGYFLYVSRMEHPGKNHVGLIAAYEKYRESLGRGGGSEAAAGLVFVGADWAGSEVVRRRVEESAYRGDIRVKGFVEEGELPLWYGAAAGMVMPSFFEGFGLPLVEAMACGCPVAASDLEVFREVAGGSAVYFDPQDVGSMAEVLRQMVSRDAGELGEVRAEGIARAKMFSWERAASEIWEIYQNEEPKVLQSEWK